MNFSYVESLLRRIQQLESDQGIIEPRPSPKGSGFGEQTSHDVRHYVEQAIPQGLQSNNAATHEEQDSQEANDSCWPSRSRSADSSIGPAPPLLIIDSHAPPQMGNYHDTSEEGLAAGEDSENENDRDSIDAMGSTSNNLAQSRPGPNQTSTPYFGPSSVIHFMNQVKDAIPNLGGCAQLKCQSEDECWCKSERKVFSDINFWELNVPPRECADALVNSYWNSVASLYPFLHKPTFTAKYLRIWQPAKTSSSGQGPCKGKSPEKGFQARTSRDRLFYCTLNVVFALACNFQPSTPIAERPSNGVIFFSRAKSLLHFDIMEQGSIELVQTLLLISQYLQSTEMVSTCWQITGLAIRVAQGLGLHLSAMNNSMSQLQIEMRRRLWGGCIMMDRYVTQRPICYSRSLHSPYTPAGVCSLLSFGWVLPLRR